MINLELRLLSTMLASGDFSPIAQGDITEEHFQTDQGKAVHGLVVGWASMGTGERWPSLAIIRNRFPSVDLPDPDPGDRVKALGHEVRMEKMRTDVRVISTELEVLSKVPDPMAELDRMAARLRKLSEPVRKTKHLSLKTVIGEILSDYDTGNILPEGIAWPWPSLQKVTRGMHKKEFYIFAGRPKSRKTFVAGHVGVDAFMTHGERVLFFTPEMPPRQIMLRCVADMAKIRYTEFKNGELDKSEIARLIDLADEFGILDSEDEEHYSFRLKNIPRYTGDKPPPSFDVIQSTGRDVSWMETQIELFDPSIIICDSFYRQEGGKKYDSDWKAIAAVSRRLKDITMERNVVTIGTVQMNRGAEKEVGTLSNLSLSDAIGQDADVIMRVITGKLEGEERSALAVLGGREVPFDGILISNRPCWDFGEIGIITSKKQVTDLMNKDDEEPDEKKGAKGPKRRGEGKVDTPQEGSINFAKKHLRNDSEGVDDLSDLVPDTSATEDEEDDDS